MHLERLHYKTGAMKNLNICGNIKILSLMFYTCCFFLQADGETIFAVAGSIVTLKCNNKSIDTLTHLEWKMNTSQQLFAFMPGQELHSTDEAQHLNITMSDLESQLYALIIERAHDSHTGNYTCKTSTATGAWERTSELIITEPQEITKRWSTLLIAVAAGVPCVCVLILIITLTVLLIVRRKRAQCVENSIYSLAGDVQVQQGDIYENCLENISYNQQCRHKSRTHRSKEQP